MGTTDQKRENRNIFARDVSSVAVDSREDATTFQSKKLVEEISNYLSIEASEGETKCRLCPNNFDCNSFCITAHKKEIIWPRYDESVYNITLEDIQTFFETHIAPLDSNIKVETNNKDHKDNVGSQCQNEKESPNNSDVDLEYEICTIPPSEKTMTYEAPKTLDFLLNKYSTSIIEVNEFSQEIEVKNGRKQLSENVDNTDPLSFFKLNTIKDLFQCIRGSDSQETIIYSPDIIENSFTTNINTRDNEFERNNVSPVLCTFERARSIKNFQRKLFPSQENPTDVSKSTPPKNTERNKPNLRKLYSSPELNKQIHTPSKFSKNIIMSSSTPMSKFFDKSVFQENSPSVKKHEMNELKNSKNNSSHKANIIQNKIDITDLCDLSIFGLSTSENAIPTVSRITNKISNASISTSHNTDVYTKDICDLKHEISAYSIQKNDAQESYSNKNNICVETNNECRINIVPKSNCSVKNGLKGYNILNKSGSENCIRPTHTQISITQMIDLINADETTPQKENIDVSNRSLTSFSSRKSKIKKKRVNPFIESQAELSISEQVNISEDEEDEDQNLYDASFIDDDTQNMNTQIHINYLQSTRSPRKQCKFKIPQKPTRFIHVYSQEVEPDDTYLDDSFVVHDETEEVHHELSELEILEEKLKKKKRKPSEDIAKHVKRKRIKQILSDDSD